MALEGTGQQPKPLRGGGGVRGLNVFYQDLICSYQKPKHVKKVPLQVCANEG